MMNVRFVFLALGILCAGCGGSGADGLDDASSGQEGEAESEGETGTESESESESEGACTLDCDDGIACTDDHLRLATCECEHELLHGRCPLGEVCHPTDGCTSGSICTDIEDCPDPGDPCIVIGCDPGSATCTYTPLDRDGDGHSPQICTSVDGDDCDDTPVKTGPDDICRGPNDSDDDCGGRYVYPGAEEFCDGRDNDCNGEIDDLPEIGMPCDGYDGDQCEEGVIMGCRFNYDGGSYEVDCTDWTTTSSETCNGLDDDCDGLVDRYGDDLLSVPCGSDMGTCQEGRSLCLDGTWADCEGGTGPTTEYCMGNDDDCDGLVDCADDDCLNRGCCTRGSRDACVAYYGEEINGFCNEFGSCQGR